MSVTLILGGARSGKSRLAESLAHGQKHYIATAQAGDEEMRERIAHHRTRRGAGWTTHEELYHLAGVLRPLNKAGNFILVDCLTVWLSNLMLGERDWQTAADLLCSALEDQRADVVLVSNEVGLGIVPIMPLGRDFRDAQGLLNQQVAAAADNVAFVAAGLPMILKGELPRRTAGSA
jgi:adenosylcobinamide kinase/adenosylcobinamide-phosphate guanylyltransferase